MRGIGRIFERRLAVGILLWAVAAHPAPVGSQSADSASVSDEAVEEFLFTAEKALDEGRFGEAIAVYRQVLRDYPETTLRDRIHIKLAESYQKNNDPAGAVAVLEAFLDEFPDSPDVDGALSTAADLYIELGDLQKAATALERQRGLTQDSARRQEVTERLVNVLVDREERVEAIRNLLLMIDDSKEPDREQEIRKRVQELVLSMKEPELNRAIEMFGRKYPSDRALLRLAEIEEGKDLLFEADRELRRFLDTFQGHPEVDSVYARLFGIKKKLLEYRFLIGVVLPASEKYRPFSSEVLNGVRLAADRFVPSAAGAAQGKFVGLVIRNTEGDEKRMERSFEELAKEYNVVAVVGPLLSRSLEAAAREARKHRLPVISPSASQELSVPSGGFLFRNSITLREQGKFMAEYALSTLGFRRFCILYPDDAYGNGLMRAFRDTVLKNGGEIIALQSYAPEDKDMGEQIRRMKKEDLALYGVMEPVPEAVPPAEKYTPGFDAIYLPGDYDQVGLASAQLAFYDVTGVTLLGSNGWNSRELIRIAGRSVEGGVFVDGFFSGSEEPAIREFTAAYRQRFEKEPTLLSAQAYDAMLMLLQGIQAGGKSPADLRSYLESVRDFPGASGTYQFAPGGVLTRPLQVIRVSEGKFIQAD